MLEIQYKHINLVGDVCFRMCLYYLRVYLGAFTYVCKIYFTSMCTVKYVTLNKHKQAKLQWQGTTKKEGVNAETTEND